MNRLLVWTLTVLMASMVFILPACDQVSSFDVNQAEKEPMTISWRERYLQLGQETYQGNCAQCHDEGIDNAPVIGDKEQWSGRSPLWSAVLMVHAKNGYLGMPAKGGCAELSERSVEAAGEYMLSVTFPELPRD